MACKDVVWRCSSVGGRIWVIKDPYIKKCGLKTTSPPETSRFDVQPGTVLAVCTAGLKTYSIERLQLVFRGDIGARFSKQWELCNYVIITIAAWLKIENWASGVMFDRARSQLTGKEVVLHS